MVNASDKFSSGSQAGADSSIKSLVDENAQSLVNEIAWFARVVNARLEEYFGKDNVEIVINKDDHGPGKSPNSNAVIIDTVVSDVIPISPATEIMNPPVLGNDQSVYAGFVKYYELKANERLLLMLALMPYLQPHLLDVFFSANKKLGRGYTEFGGIKGSRHGGFIPTIETALFILAGNDLGQRFRLYKLFEPDHVFSAHGIIVLDQGNGANEPFYSSSISISEEYVDFFTTGNLRRPQFSMEFPAKRLTTQMNWNDLVVEDYTMQQLDELRIWLEHSPKLYKDWGMAKKLKMGYKALFHGAPGTGKTLTAAVLGKLYNLDVYRIDLSMVISKYIGETEKNLEKVFKKAENKNWILFFDEADALFGKRTGITDAHDKYANQEIAYLLQRLEDYPGLVILASNMRNNVDEAFTRRLQSIIHFQKPQARERFRLWNNGFSTACKKPPQNELETIAREYELSGGAIMNIVQYASLLALNRNDNEVTISDVLKGIKNEYNKEGKTL
ncbi:MAG: ATPase family associated with various cellular [Ferruginibacter sp.]|nr:ATPase family associated with various cellular [Ferruginibacter sp.]